MSSQASTLSSMDIQPSSILATITLGLETKHCFLNSDESIERIIISRKTPNRAGNQRKQNLQRILFPSVSRLSTDHALFTITKRDTYSFNNNLNFILGGRFDNNILNLIASYLCPKIEVTVRDLASKCGTYIPKYRPLKIQQFWLMAPQTQYSFGVYFLSTPGQFQKQIEDSSLIQYIQRCTTFSINQNLKERAMSCKLSNVQEMQDISRSILRNYSVAILSHNSNGYLFIVQPDNHEISIQNYFKGKILKDKLHIQSELILYTNIAKQRQLGEREFSDAYKIKQKQVLIIGEERCLLTIEA